MDISDTDDTAKPLPGAKDFSQTLPEEGHVIGIETQLGGDFVPNPDSPWLKRYLEPHCG